jgi:hypothetical protein
MLPIDIGTRNEIVRDFDAEAKSPATGHGRDSLAEFCFRFNVPKG